MELRENIERALSCLNRNELHEAERHLSEVLANSTEDASALQLLGIIRREQGRYSEAEAFYRRSLARQPNQAHVHFNLGNLMRAQGRLPDAIAEHREAIRLKPNYLDAYLGLALSLSESGDHAAAAQSCRALLRVQPNHLAAKQALSIELCELGRPEEAEGILRQALALGLKDSRQQAIFEHNLAITLNQQLRHAEALAMFDAARARAPDLPSVDFNRGTALQELGRLDEAATAYRLALARTPEDTAALACLATTCGQMGDFANARLYGERALAHDANQPFALIGLALADLEDGAFATAQATLRKILENPQLRRSRYFSFALSLAGDAFDGQGLVADAFASYSAANAAVRKRGAPRWSSGRAIDDVTRLLARFASSGGWDSGPVGAATPAAGHVFLLGFMRSGTTLLEAVLASHSRVAAMDEIDLLADAARNFLLDDGGLGRLAQLDRKETSRWQERYWNSVKATGRSVANRILLDKMPLNSLRMPLLSRLFPEAKIIFAVRDPRDVVLSCFRRRFSPTKHTFEFLDLTDCARFYASVMELAELYRERMKFDIREFRYEDMVCDFEPTVQAVCDFVGIEWADSMRDFSSAGALNPRGASAIQVARGLYPDAAGQWRRYREQLAPVLPLLEPWVARFGYPPD